MRDLYQKAAALPVDDLPPIPDNYGIPANEPAAIQAHLKTTAVTPSSIMRKNFDKKDWRIYRWIYHRLTERVDSEIGIILDGLKKAGLENDTLIIFTSDHGDMDASHRLASKGMPYDESVRVPLIIKYPAMIPAGETDREHPVSTGLDLLPTLCDYAGVPKPEHLLGQSLRPLAEGAASNGRRPYVPSENAWFRMIRSKRYKYCAFAPPEGGELLVDMENDPDEMRNLADDPRFQKVLSEHRRLLSDWGRISGDEDASKYVKNR